MTYSFDGFDRCSNRGFVPSLPSRLGAKVCIAALLVLAIAGCASPERSAPVPTADVVNAMPLGIENARFYPGEQHDEILAEFRRAADRQRQALPHLCVRQVMTPRHALKAVDGDRALGSVIDELLEIGFSRFPIYERQLDHVIGIAHIRDLLRIHRSDPSRLVRDAMRPPLFVPERSRAAALLAIFRKQQHMAVVVSELGTVEGVITLEDVLEEIVGEIADEYDEAEEELFVERDDGSFLIAGLAPIDRVQQTLAIDAFPEEERYSFETLAGFILSLLGHMPHTGDKVDWSGWRFEVVDMDGLRIDKVLASPLAKS